MVLPMQNGMIRTGLPYISKVKTASAERTQEVEIVHPMSLIKDEPKIDYIKCDIEGAERVIFEDSNFFENFKPRIIIECHVVDGIDTTKKCVEDLSKYGYKCRPIEQFGVSLPLIECYPPSV